jgi:two-component system chemotaxis sensor kinase CheA
VPDLLKSAEKSTSSISTIRNSEIQKNRISKSILVADDSITSRMLIKDILESSGYKVTTAIDGLEALTMLKMQKYDAVVSDIEMPGMTGFELTYNIRSDFKLADLPVVLVTALATQEDREKGIDAGANAYIVKSDFDQNNLRETIKRLI